MVMSMRYAIAIILITWLISGLVWAADDEDSSDGTASYIDIAAVVDNIEHDEEMSEWRGFSADDWAVGLRWLHPDEALVRERFELRLWDVQRHNGRGWGRFSAWPATLEFEAMLFNSFAWDLYGNQADLVEQEHAYDKMAIRFHDTLLENMQFNYYARIFNREKSGLLDDYSMHRLGYVYRFDLWDGQTTGLFKISSTETDNERLGLEDLQYVTSLIRAESKLGDYFTLYTRDTYTTYNYEHMVEDSFDSADMTLGLRWKPNKTWTLDANYNYADRPDDNTVSTHVEDSSAFAVKATYFADPGKRIEAGFRHREIDMLRLNLDNPGTRDLLRSGSVISPDNISDALGSLSVDQDEWWVRLRWKFFERLDVDSKVNYRNSDFPGTTVGTTGNSLLYDEQLSHINRLTYDVNGNDQLSFVWHMQESSNGERGGDFDMRYLEGAWSRSFGGDSYFNLAVSNTEADLDTTGIVNDYTTCDTTYALNIGDRWRDLDWNFDANYTDGNDIEEYDQFGLGADFNLERWGPLNFRVDWWNRNYDARDAFDSEAVEVSVTYRIFF